VPASLHLARVPPSHIHTLAYVQGLIIDAEALYEFNVERLADAFFSGTLAGARTDLSLLAVVAPT
jgi:hypothetical protein